MGEGGTSSLLQPFFSIRESSRRKKRGAGESFRRMKSLTERRRPLADRILVSPWYLPVVPVVYSSKAVGIKHAMDLTLNTKNICKYLNFYVGSRLKWSYFGYIRLNIKMNFAFVFSMHLLEKLPLQIWLVLYSVGQHCPMPTAPLNSPV